MPLKCFQIHKDDNVATLLQDAAEAAEITVRGDASHNTAFHALQSIRAGHKVAVVPIAQGERILKYGYPIGEATQSIAQGAWVHLHNCRSLYDDASSSLGIESGLRKETRYA